MEKPSSYDVNASIDEKIALLKSEGHNYSEKSLAGLMQVINEENIVKLDLDRIAQTPAFHNLQLTLDDPSIDIPEAFKQAILPVLQSRKAGGDEEKTRELRNFVATGAAELEKEIETFLRRYQRTQADTCLSDLTRNKGAVDEESGTPLGLLLMKDYAHLLVRVLPNVIINEVAYDAIKIPKHWNLSERHNSDVRAFVAKFYKPLVRFYGEPGLRTLLRSFVTQTSGLYTMLVELHEGGASSPFDSRTIGLIAHYVFVSILKEYILLATRSPELIGAYEDDDQDEDTEFGAREELATNAAEALTSMLEIVCDEKRLTDIPYTELMKRVHRAKEREKDLHTTRLAALTDEERDADTQLKKHKLGTWGKGFEKGMRTYQGETYDQEIDDMETQALREMRAGERNMVTAMNRDIYAMDALAEQAEADRIEAEEMSLAHLADDDDYGDMDGDEGF